MPAAPKHPGAASFVPAGRPVPELAEAVQACRGCDIADNGSHAVFGTGALDARVMLVGEQPGDVEEQRGAPFVGPAGRLLDRALADAGLDRSTAYVTNAVKHFKFTLSDTSKRRIHQSPDVHEVLACRPWLEAELNRVRPELVVLLGATAAKALLGNSFRVTQQRGQLFDGPAGSGARLIATIHPSAVLRADADSRDAAYDGLVADLRTAAAVLTPR